LIVNNPFFKAESDQGCGHFCRELLTFIHPNVFLAQKALKHRRVKHYGFEFRYDNNNVDKDKPLPAGKSDLF